MIKTGLIGIGAWGKNLLRNFYGLPNCELVICCDQDEKQLQRTQKSYPGVKVTTDPQEVISNNQIQAVIIATPPASHFDLAKRSILAGKDVFVEKPLVLDVKQGEELVNLAEKNKRVLMVGHIMEYHPASLALKKYIDSGEPLKSECQHFIECVEKRTKPRNDGEDGLRVLRVLDAAQRSLKQGGVPVKIAA